MREDCLTNESAACDCAYHQWLRSGRMLQNISANNKLLSVPSAKRSVHISFLEKSAVTESSALVTNENLFKRRKLTTESNAKVRVARMIGLLNLLAKAPWASKSFTVNESIIRRLVASHLPLIVGEKDWKSERSSLLELIGPDLENAQNTVWCTNRQQGKTTTLSKFVAALALVSPVGGNLFCVYSTNLDRAQELTRAAKKYLYWVSTQTEALSSLDIPPPSFVVDNERVFSLKVESVVNTVIARPKSPDSCRGDAPRAAIFDEIAFVTADFWFKFAYPLLQISKRVFTCATTPPPPGNFFSVFAEKVRERNADGDFFFKLINHSLVCPKCFDSGQAERCVHRLGLVPPWKSLLRFTRMKALVPASRQADYEAEVFGVMRLEGGKYFPAKIVDASLLRRALWTGNPFSETAIIYIAVDPASHNRSQMGLSALTYTSDGAIIILGLSSVGVERCGVLQVQMIVASFLSRVLSHVFVRARSRSTRFWVQPIIECNGSEVTATSILESIRSTAVQKKARVANPWSKKVFSHNITPDVGVWTTDRNKLSAIQTLYTALFDGRVSCAKDGATVGEVFRAGAKTPTFLSQRELLAAQLKSIRDTPSGKVSGKSADTEDDLAMSTLLGFYWSYCIRAAMASGGITLRE